MGTVFSFLILAKITKFRSESYCQNLPEIENLAKKLVTKVIDGDTFLIEGGYSVRILGIDADERGYDCFFEAKKRLEELILQKEVILEKDKENFDNYCRYLRHVFLNGENIGLKLIKEGLVIVRFAKENLKYRKEFLLAEKEAIEKNLGCKWKREMGRIFGKIREYKGRAEIILEKKEQIEIGK